MPKKIYNTEREGQMDFFDNYRISYNDDSFVLVDNTDGVYHGNLLEFKLNIQSVRKVLFQAVKYLLKLDEGNNICNKETSRFYEGGAF